MVWKIWTKIYCSARNLLVHHSSLSHTTYVETNDIKIIFQHRHLILKSNWHNDAGTKVLATLDKSVCVTLQSLNKQFSKSGIGVKFFLKYDSYQAEKKKCCLLCVSLKLALHIEFLQAQAKVTRKANSRHCSQCVDIPSFFVLIKCIPSLHCNPANLDRKSSILFVHFSLHRESDGPMKNLRWGRTCDGQISLENFYFFNIFNIYA